MEYDEYKFNDKVPWSQLQDAVAKNNEAGVRILIDGVNLSKTGNTALFTAANLGYARMVALLMDNGAWFNLAQVHPFFAAARNGHTDVLQVLISKGIRPLDVSWNGYTPLHTAAHFGHLEVVRFLLPHIPVDTVHPNNFTTAFILAVKAGHLEIAEFLLQNGCDLEFGVKGRSPLLKAVESNHLPMVQFLLAHKANPKKVCDIGTTVIYHAASKQNAAMLEMLIPLVPEFMNLPTLSGFSPLHAAVLKNSVPVVKVLLKHGAHIDQQSTTGSTALHYAFDKKNEEMIVLLISAGAKIGYGPMNMSRESMDLTQKVCALNLKALAPDSFVYFKNLLFTGNAPYPKQWVSRMMPEQRIKLIRWVNDEVHAEKACRATVYSRFSKCAEGAEGVDLLYRKLYDFEPVRELIALYLVRPKKDRERLHELKAALSLP
jgi:ankyrin repeat protein